MRLIWLSTLRGKVQKYLAATTAIVKTSAAVTLAKQWAAGVQRTHQVVNDDAAGYNQSVVDACLGSR